MEKSVNLNFHQTFQPEAEYLSALLEIADEGPLMTKQEISRKTGIPTGKSSGKVEPHIAYAAAMGLIKYEKIAEKASENVEDGKVLKTAERYKLSRTELGEAIFQEDPGLTEKVSLILMHANMVRQGSDTVIWDEMFQSVFPSFKNCIPQNTVISLLKNKYKKINLQNFSPFTRIYGDSGIFGCLELVNKSNEKDNPILTLSPFNVESELEYALGYILYDYWNQKFKDEQEITIDQVFSLGFGKAFGWNEDQEMSVLDKLALKGIIRLNRQLVPIIVYRLTTIDKLKDSLYRDLI